MSIALILMSVLCIPELVAAAFAAAGFRKLPAELKQFVVFIFFSAAVEIASIILWTLHKNNMPLLHLHVAAGFTFLVLFYRQILAAYIDRRIFVALILTFWLFAIVNAVFVQPVFAFCSYTLTTEAVLLIILSFFTLMIAQHEFLRENRSSSFKSINWINAGIFIYYSSALLLFYFGDLINRSFPVYLSRYTWALHAFFSAVMYTCFIIALWKSPKKSVS